MEYRTNAFKGYNGVGAILTVLCGGLVALFQTAPHRPMPFRFDLLMLAASVVLIFVRVTVEIRNGEIRLGRGVWPFLVWKESRLSDVTEAVLSGGRSRTSTIVTVSLVAPSGKVPLTIGGTKGELRDAMSFVRTLHVPVRATDGLERVAPPWLVEIAPEAF